MAVSGRADRWPRGLRWREGGGGVVVVVGLDGGSSHRLGWPCTTYGGAMEVHGWAYACCVEREREREREKERGVE